MDRLIKYFTIAAPNPLLFFYTHVIAVEVLIFSVSLSIMHMDSIHHLLEQAFIFYGPYLFIVVSMSTPN